jgi:thiosulfate/3-mercaptopyruvate sulfurtransferase
MSLLGSKHLQILEICTGFVIFLALAYGVHAAECSDLIKCDIGSSGWDPMQKLDEIGTGQYDQPQQTSAKIPALSREKRWNKAAYGFEDEDNQTAKEAVQKDNKATENKPGPEEAGESEVALDRSDELKKMLVPIDDLSEADILMDVSEDTTEFIQGAVSVPYAEFLQNGSLKSVQDVAKILGDAGISANDSVIIYGECLPCGGGPAASTYVYWMMKSLGHENVRVMDGTVADWKALGLPTTNESSIRPGTIYVPNYTPEFIATYDYVKSGSPQIVDARTMQDFGSGSIPGAINIPYESVIKNGKLKDEAALRRSFAILNDDRPVVVYTVTGVKASVVWFALELLGYNAKLYSWQDWMTNEAPKGNFSDQ